ncbi:methyl-accepting chemotaxis protein [Vibrio hannami]|uniref:methyl-accepting chemotaxis protein n=1 Tax=Vibrio hannami TaxID=2717094 RepID=UPI00240FD4AC|nr:methyl-accepting chemotaxis protein [Vibrio hannami]MDG3087761.1 methyl-accepting chemotaxis protein [Vibrio hannami]
MNVKQKLVTLSALLILVVISILTIYSDYNFKNSSKEKTLLSLEESASLISHTIENRLQIYFTGLHLASETIAVDDSGMPIMFQLSGQLESLEQGLHMFGAAYAMNNGLTYKPTGLIPDFNAKKLQREWFVRSMANEENVATLPYVNNIGELVMSLSVPVKRNQKVVGVLNANISVNELSDLTQEITKKGQVFISREDGYILASKFNEDIGNNIYSLFPSFKNSISKEEGHTFDFNNEKAYVVKATLPNVGWNVWSWEKWENINADAEKNTISSVIFSIISIIISIVILYQLVHRYMYNPVGGDPLEIERYVKEIAKGDLRKTQSEDLNGKTGINLSIHTMSKQLTESVQKINAASTQLGEASLVSSASANDLIQSSQAQMEQLELASSAMNQMSATVTEVAQNAMNASDASEQAKQYSQHGQEVVSNMNNEITALVSSMDDVSAVIRELDKESKSIASVLSVISDISEQTNLLALNAAIEAARAGEQGRGFAVVADEVRKLASNTNQSIDEIRGVIQRLQELSHRSVEEMHTNVDKAKMTLNSSANADEVLSSIQHSVNLITDMNSQIAVAAEEQTKVAQEINNSIIEINDAAKLNYQRSEGNKEHATELSAISKSIANSVEFFRV